MDSINPSRGVPEGPKTPPNPSVIYTTNLETFKHKGSGRLFGSNYDLKKNRERLKEGEEVDGYEELNVRERKRRVSPRELRERIESFFTRRGLLFSRGGQFPSRKEQGTKTKVSERH